MFKLRDALLGLFLIIALAGCAGLPPRDPQYQLIGAWYGNARSVDTGEVGDNIIIRTGDGRFAGYFRVCDHGQQTQGIETGRWTIQGNVMTVITETVNGIPVDADEYYRETYKITAVSRDVVSYSSIKEGHDFSSTRITGNARIPDNVCD